MARPDALDTLQVHEGFEDPRLWEQCILLAHQQAKQEPDWARLLESIYLQEDRAAAFRAFLESTIPAAISHLLQRCGITLDSEIVDLGCGAGHLTYALHQLGYRHLCAMDPNTHWNSGTGYLQSVLGQRIHIINDLGQWRQITGRYDAAVSVATIHH